MSSLDHFDVKRRITALAFLLPMSIGDVLADGLATDYDAVPPTISSAGSGDKPNIMVILDNSNSMDEDATGRAVGSANPTSKSEVARQALQSIINTFEDSMRMGLMAYEQNGVVAQKLHDSQYDVSYDGANYDPDYSGDRDSLTKARRIVNPTDNSNYIHYNIALPFYSGSNLANAFCYSSTADFDNGSEDASSGPWDSYACYKTKTGNSDSGTTGLSNHWFNTQLLPTDSDLAQNILDFGNHFTWQYVSETWYANSSPGGGTVHLGIAEVSGSHQTDLLAKLATSQFASAVDTPLRNAGLTPIQGTLQDAETYFSSYTSGNTCPETSDYVILVTDGLPSTDSSGNVITDTAQAVADAAAAAQSLFDNEGVRTYVIGFALPNGVDPTLLDTIAAAGQTGTALYADDTTLNSTLSNLFLNIINRASSGTGASIQSNNSKGDGAFYDALYIPKIEDSDGREVSWVGVLNSLFFDRHGYFREDSDGDGTLDGYNTDKIVEYYYDELEGRTRIYRMASTSDTEPTGLSVEATVELEDVNYIWSARDQLALISDPVTQRDYDTSAATGRAIYTSIDGVNLGNFSAFDQATLDALTQAASDAQTALTDAKAALTPTIVNTYNGANNSKNEAYDTAYEPAYNTAYQAAIDGGAEIADAEVTAATAAEAAALSDADYLAAVAVYEAAEAAYTPLQEAVDQAQANYDEALALSTNAGFAAFMDVTAVDADKIIRWVRGEEISGYRSRQLDFISNGTTGGKQNPETWRLGDIIHSTPAVVGAPINRYDQKYGDATYASYVDTYYNRRNVVYVGANDGMLHAFNAGFWNDSTKTFETAPSGLTVTAHPLGTELWAYVPKATLPHLQWLTSPSYAHSYYVDGEPQVFDVNIFEDSAVHPGGWGTILVVNMRFGGGPYSVDSDGDTVDDTVLRSSIMIFDVTNPEQAPDLLAEFSHPELGFTTGKPALVKARLEGSSTFGSYGSIGANRWLLAFGSGPNLLDSGTVAADSYLSGGETNSGTAKLFLYDLETLQFVTGFAPFDLNVANSYLGDIGVVDWDNDFVDDALYFGVNSGIDLASSDTETGYIARIILDSDDTSNFSESGWLSNAISSGTSSVKILLNSQRTTIGAPVGVRDDLGRRWVYGGTGRLFVADDNASDKQQRFYGIMEPLDNTGALNYATVSFSNLEDVTDIDVYTNGEVDKSGSTFQVITGEDVLNFDQLKNAISEGKAGWYVDLKPSVSGGPSARNINGSTYFRELLLYTEYRPNADSCKPEGESWLNVVHYKTGTAPAYDVIGTDSSTTKNDGELVEQELDLGQGLASQPKVGTTAEGSFAYIKSSTGDTEIIELKDPPSIAGRESWREIEMDGLDL